MDAPIHLNLTVQITSELYVKHDEEERYALLAIDLGLLQKPETPARWPLSSCCTYWLSPAFDCDVLSMKESTTCNAVACPGIRMYPALWLCL